MSDHLRYANVSAETQQLALIEMLRSQPHIMAILKGMNELGLSDPLLGSGAIYNTVWNLLTGREPLTGIKDADVVYFDGADLSYEAEDAVIQRCFVYFADLPIPVEVRNQARVHLWFPQKFGMACPQLKRSADMMLYYATKTHQWRPVSSQMEKSPSMPLSGWPTCLPFASRPIRRSTTVGPITKRPHGRG